MYDICFNIINYLIFNIQYFINGLFSSILYLFGSGSIPSKVVTPRKYVHASNNYQETNPHLLLRENSQMFKYLREENIELFPYPDMMATHFVYLLVILCELILVQHSYAPTGKYTYFLLLNCGSMLLRLLIYITYFKQNLRFALQIVNT